MYDLILQIVNAPSEFNADIVSACCVLIVVLTVVFIDLIYRVFRHFWR